MNVNEFTCRMEGKVFAHPKGLLLLFTVITLCMAYPASQLHIDAGFEKNLPIQHPYIQTLLHYQQDFGGANRVLIALRAKDSDIFSASFFDTVRAVTEEVNSLPGVDRSTIRSIFTPNVRFIEVIEGGFTGGTVIASDFSPTPESLEQVRKNILKSGIVGRLVANDFTAVVVSAELVEIDPRTRQKLDYVAVADFLENKIRLEYASDQIDVHIIGFAKVVGDIADGVKGVIFFFGLAFLITTILAYLLTHSFVLTIRALLCPMIALVWTFGMLTLLGFGLDPLSILVPFLIFAIGVSHGLQMISAFGAEVYEGRSEQSAAQVAFRRLLIPCGIALVTDGLGFLTFLTIEITTIREIAITASLGVLAIVMTNLFFLPVLLSYVCLEDGYRNERERRVKRMAAFWEAFTRMVDPRWSVFTLAGAIVLLIGGLIEARNVKTGDLQSGVPELRQDSRYNQDTAMILNKFSIGVDVLTVFVETIQDGCVRHDIMDGIDRFQWYVANAEGVQSTMSLPQVAKIINAGWNEGHLKWRVLPRNPQTMVQAISPIETSSGLLNQDCSVMPVYIFLEDHKADTITGVLTTLKRYATEHESNLHTFRLAGGNIGVMVATNQVVDDAQVKMLFGIYSAVLGLCLLTFRSWRAALCIVLPLALVSILAYGLMSLLEIGLKISTLPMVVLGVGIGVDYGIYMLSRLKRFLDEGCNLRVAYLRTICVTGDAVVITGLALTAGVSTWIFSALKFQVDMGILLTFLFLANMLATILFLPALVCAFYPQTMYKGDGVKSKASTTNC